MKSDYKYEIILYPESDIYNFAEVLEDCQLFFSEWAWICHDRDKNADGTDKDIHVHFIGKNDEDDRIVPQVLAQRLGIPVQYISFIKSWRACVRYLCHLDDSSKAPYDPSEVTANFDYLRFYNTKSDDDKMAKRILSYVKLHPMITTCELTEYCIENGMYSAYRRGYAIWSTILREEKEKIKCKL